MKLRENFEVGGEADANGPGMVGEVQQPGEYAVDFYKGSGLPPDQVELQSTPIKPYIDNPDLARMEQEVALARYGGKSIDGRYLDEESGKVMGGPPAGGPPDQSRAPYGQPRNAQEGPGYNRSEFEKSIFKQIGGNPFEIDVMKELDKVTAQDLPYLFRNVFGGKLIWEDRRRMDEGQRKFWDNEVKKYRSHVKDMIESDKKTKVDMYNFATKQFDNEQKEHEAAAKKVAEHEKQFRERYEKEQEKRTKGEQDRLKTMRDMAAAERSILKDMNQILKGDDNGKLTAEQSQMATILNAQLQELRQQMHGFKMQTDKGYRTKFEEEDRQRRGDAGQSRVETNRPMPTEPGATGKGADKDKPKVAQVDGASVVVGPEGPPVQVRRLRDGRLAGQFADGTRRIVEEASTTGR